MSYPLVASEILFAGTERLQMSQKAPVAERLPIVTHHNRVEDRTFAAFTRLDVRLC
jgi:hypothetical protein